MKTTSRNSFTKKLKEKYKDQFDFHVEPQHEFYIEGEEKDNILNIIRQQNIHLNHNDINDYHWKGELKKGRIFHIGSSMRFCIKALQGVSHNPSYEYDEIKIPGINGEKPHYDCHFDDEEYEYFIEAKCMELFDNNVFDNKKKNHTLSIQYHDFFLRKIAHILGLDCDKIPWEEFSYQTIMGDCEEFKLKKHPFDLKQFLCHLMGIIASQENTPKKKVRLCYLVYKNADIRADEYCLFEKQIKAVAQRFSEVFGKYNMEFGYLFHDDFTQISDFNGMQLLYQKI